MDVLPHSQPHTQRWKNKVNVSWKYTTVGHQACGKWTYMPIPVQNPHHQCHQTTQPHPHGPPRYNKSSSQQASQHDQLGNTWTRGLIRPPRNSPRSLPYILHPQDSPWICLWHNIALTREGITPKPLPSRCSDACIRVPDIGPPKYHPSSPIPHLGDKLI